MSTVPIIKKGKFQGCDVEEKEMDPTDVSHIDKISIDYLDDCIYGLTVYFTREGTKQCTGRWGSKPDGAYTREVILTKNEYITSVKVYMDYCVTLLAISTNFDFYGPYGDDGRTKVGKYFEYTGEFIMGFHAYCSDKVNALGVYVLESNGTIIKKGSFLGDIVKHMDPTGITRIVKISIYHSDKIDALTVYFECNGITQCTDRWGGDGGKLTEINLEAIEYVKSVKGYRDSGILKSLVLATNLNVYGPYGKEVGASFEHTSPIRHQIIGFFAHIRNNYITYFGVYVKQVKVFISKSVLCGGSGGSTRDMHQMFAVSRIVNVSIHHDDNIDALSVCYELEDDTTERTSLWGGETGTLSKIDLQYNEYIKAVRGYVGYFGDIFIVRALQLITNKRSYGPYGKEEGTPFELSAFGGKIIGFHGRSGAYLDAIGVYVQWREEK